MKRKISIAAATVAAVLLTCTMSVSAQDFNTQKRTIMTFSAPVEMPGVTLPAGTYVFRIADTPSRNVVQVLDKNEKDMIGQWLYVSAERPQVSGETVVTFKETKEGTTPAVQFWYYPGERTGKEFIYPKEQALKIAARTGVGVRTDDGVVNGSGLPAADAAVATTEPASTSGDVYAQAQTTPAETLRTSSAVGTSGRYDGPAVGTSGADQSASVRQDTNVRQESTTASNRTELPRTASRLPLSGILGFLALAGAAGLRKFRQQ